jgi:hypothetical protein
MKTTTNTKTMAARSAHIDALWTAVIAARKTFDASPTHENAKALGRARLAWQRAE